MNKLLILLACLAFAACGGDDDGGDNGGSGDSGDRAGQTTGGDSGGGGDTGADADAQSQVRTIVTYVETCYADTQDYGGCLDIEKINQETGLDLEEEAVIGTPGTVSFGPREPDEYVITVTSESGTGFQLAKTADGGSLRLCTKPGEGDCPEDGKW